MATVSTAPLLREDAAGVRTLVLNRPERRNALSLALLRELIAALAETLVRVIEDESLRIRLAKGARARFLEKFDVRHYAARLEQLHADLFGPPLDRPKPVEKGLIS